MKKSDLKDGMVVECRNGQRYIVLGNNFVSNTGFNDMDYYTSDLDCDYSDFDIIKVYKVFDCTNINQIFDKSICLRLLWLRDDNPIELTLEDIAEKFEVDVSQIKIKR